MAKNDKFEKQYGRDLLKKYDQAKRALINSESKIVKRFELIISEENRKYMREEDRNYLNVVSLSDVDYKKMCEIIMNTEAEYVRQTSNQGELF